jgi:hypothetical protein
LILLNNSGAFRKGKSFLLNFLLRYLEAGGAEDWLGDDQTILKGFKWRYVFLKIFFGGFFSIVSYYVYSPLLYLPPLRFHCADGC